MLVSCFEFIQILVDFLKFKLEWNSKTNLRPYGERANGNKEEENGVGGSETSNISSLYAFKYSNILQVFFVPMRVWSKMLKEQKNCSKAWKIFIQ
jgi:hypothetical protein